MLHAGTSLQVFTKWCHDPLNTIIMPGYCVAGTVGAKVLAGQQEIDIDKFTRVYCNMQIKNLSFSAHADAKGIMALVGMCKAKHVMLVHGEKEKMAKLKKRIEHEMGIPCFDPANGETITILPKPNIPIAVPDNYIESQYKATLDDVHEGPVKTVPVSGCVVLQDDDQLKKGSLKRLKLIPQDEASKKFSTYSPNLLEKEVGGFVTKQAFNSAQIFPRLSLDEWKSKVLKTVFENLKRNYWDGEVVVLKNDCILVAESIQITLTDECEYHVTWTIESDKEISGIMSMLNRCDLQNAK